MMARKERIFDSERSAVAAAARMRAEGYDLFRGQRRPWPIVSSFRRLPEDQRAESYARLNQFINWSKGEPALRRYGLTSDQSLAIAQHYGIPTTFIDFTTELEVARFFATEQRSKEESKGETNSMSCIIALRSRDFESWVEKKFKQTDAFAGPEIVRIDVANLWRLEAQFGVFLVDDDLLDDYQFDYLLFPEAIAPKGTLPRDRIYPEERSDLELILEQWFYHEKASAGTRYLMQEFERSMGANALTVISSEEPDEETDGIGIIGVVRPDPDSSWLAPGTKWFRGTEHFSAIRPKLEDKVCIDLEAGMRLDAVRSLVYNRLSPASIADRRKRSANWEVMVEGRTMEKESDQLSRQWDALRIDGYSDMQVFESFVTSVSLVALRLGFIAGQPEYKGQLGVGQNLEAMTTLFGWDLLVEYTGAVGYARALVSASQLRAAVRSDIDQYLPPNFYKYAGSSQAERMKQLLMGIYRPSLLFDFHRFSDLFVRQVVPTTAILRPDLPLCPVLHVKTFGLP